MIVAAAEAGPRQVLVGAPTWRAVLGQRVFPGLLDRHVARAAWESQFVDAPNDQAGDILFQTLPGDPGAHGPYLDRERGPDLSMRLRRGALALAAQPRAQIKDTTLEWAQLALGKRRSHGTADASS